MSLAGAKRRGQRAVLRRVSPRHAFAVSTPANAPRATSAGSGTRRNVMTDAKPVVIFLHYYGTGPAQELAKGVRAAIDLLGKAPAR